MRTIKTIMTGRQSHFEEKTCDCASGFKTWIWDWGEIYWKDTILHPATRGWVELYIHLQTSIKQSLALSLLYNISFIIRHASVFWGEWTYVTPKFTRIYFLHLFHSLRLKLTFIIISKEYWYCKLKSVQSPNQTQAVRVMRHSLV